MRDQEPSDGGSGGDVVPLSREPARPGRIFSVRRLVLSLLLASAGVGIVFAFSQTETEEPPRFSDSAVEGVYPGQNELDLRQARVGIDLVVGYTAVLVIDGREIPEDEHERLEPLGQVFYTPGPDKATGALEPGRHCAVAIMWRLTESREQSRRYPWCFNVH